MGQESLIYSFVARGTVILAEYTEFIGNFTTIAFQCLQKLPARNDKFTYICDGHTFNFLVDDNFYFCVIAAESIGYQVPTAFLERIRDDCTKTYEGRKAATADANSLSKDFGEKMREHMEYCVDGREDVSKITKVKSQVLEVKEVVMENIEKVLNRRVKIKLSVVKTCNRRPQAQTRLKVWWLKIMKVKKTVVIIIVGLILIILALICDSRSCI